MLASLQQNGKLRVENECPLCDQVSTVTDVPMMAFYTWYAGRGPAIQLAFPELTEQEREVLLTGYHPACWEEDFGDE